jgi:RHH-type proline utilization regulon transcriptional repressor/proline dehydrogenase/delta 1-pyrroline-5-carboxylate dehydrogenase
VVFDAALHHGDAQGLAGVMQPPRGAAGAHRRRARVRAGDTDIPLESLVVERALSVNTAAAGGNASLMTIG